MKKLLILSALAFVTYSGKAQPNQVVNRSTCPMQFRVVCIDENSCTTTPSTGWMNIPAMVPGTGAVVIPYTPPACTAPFSIGYEVRFNPSAGCGSASETIAANPMLSQPCPDLWPQTKIIGSCSCAAPGSGVSFSIGAPYELLIDPF